MITLKFEIPNDRLYRSVDGHREGGPAVENSKFRAVYPHLGNLSRAPGASATLLRRGMNSIIDFFGKCDRRFSFIRPSPYYLIQNKKVIGGAL
jgi:hypothetical protein